MNEREEIKVIKELLDEYMSSGFTDCRDATLVDRAVAVIQASEEGAIGEIVEGEEGAVTLTTPSPLARKCTSDLRRL